MRRTMQPRIAVIGAAFGKWHAREIRRLETKDACRLVALCRKSDKPFDCVYKAMRDAGLPDDRVAEYLHHGMMLDKGVDAVMVASPAQDHYEHVWDSLEAKVHVYVEKPVVWSPENDVTMNRRQGEILLEYALSRDVMLCGGSQFKEWFREDGDYWRAVPDVPDHIRSFSMTLATGSGKPLDEMVVDLLPHPLAVLHALAGSGKLVDFEIKTYPNSRTAVSINATYLPDDGIDVDFNAMLETTPDRREVSFVVNGVRVERKEERQPRYKVILRCDGIEQEVRDPLALANARFVQDVTRLNDGKSVDKQAEKKSLLHTHEMLCDCVTAYERWKQLENRSQ